MFLYNIHTPNKTFALQHKDGETYEAFLERIAPKAGLQKQDIQTLKQGKDGSGLVYEYEGERWSLEDDGDMAILHSRLPPSSTPSATLHLTPPHAHAHFAPSPAPPAYSTASSTIKSKTKSKAKSTEGHSTNGDSSANKVPALTVNGEPTGEKEKKKAPPVLGSPAGKSDKPTLKSTHADKDQDKNTEGAKSTKAKSIMSTRSRRSKWGDDDAEPLGEVNKRKWLEFHENNGVRTVMGKVGNVDNVRMLLKSGYKQVYVSRSFAIKAGFVPAKYSMGASGYAGLKSIGNIPITVGSRTGHHPALISEEQHFDVVLGRSWLERMIIKVDPLDQTALTYMDTGEPIPCDLVVLKDAQGNVITVT